MNRDRNHKIIQSLDEIPATFLSEAAEREVWETHQLSDERWRSAAAGSGSEARADAGSRRLQRFVRQGRLGLGPFR